MLSWLKLGRLRKAGRWHINFPTDSRCMVFCMQSPPRAWKMPEESGQPLASQAFKGADPLDLWIQHFCCQRAINMSRRSLSVC